MTTLARKPVPMIAAPKTADVRFVVTWRIRGFEMGRAGVVAVAGEGALDRSVELRMTIERREGAIEAIAELVGEEPGAKAIRLARMRADGGGRITWIEDDDARLVHVDAPGMVSVTLRRGAAGVAGEEDGAWRLVYARTPLLARLEIPGGRCEVTGRVE